MRWQFFGIHKRLNYLKLVTGGKGHREFASHGTHTHIKKPDINNHIVCETEILKFDSLLRRTLIHP